MAHKLTFTALGLAALLGVTWHLMTRGDAAPDVSFQTLEGDKLSLEAMRGSPVLVVFWATTCSVCIEEVPELTALYRELEPRGLKLIAVAMPYDPPSRVVAMAEAQQMPYPVALDVSSEITRAFGDIRYTPSAVLVGPEGQIQRRLVGRLDTEALHKDIDSMLLAEG